MVHIHKADCCTVYTFNISNELSAQPRALPWQETLHVLGRGRAALHQSLCPGQLCSLQPPLAPSGHCCPPQNPTLTGRDEKQVQQRQHRHLRGAKHLSFRGEQLQAVPAFLLQLEHRRGDALHTQSHRGGISLPLVSFQSSSCLPKELRACPWCVVLSLGSWQQRGRDGGPSDLRTVAHASCSQSVMRIGRKVCLIEKSCH